MGYVVLFLIICFLSLLGKGVFGFPLVLPFIMALTFSFPSEVGLGVAFFSGVFLSFLHGTILGRESLGLLVAMGILYLYSRRFSRENIVYTVVFPLLGSVLYALIVGEGFSIVRHLRDVVLVFLFLPVVSWLYERYFATKISLKL